MTENLFISVYGAGLLLVVVLIPFFIKRAIKLKFLGNRQGIKFPGGIFYLLERIDLNSLSSETTKSEIKGVRLELKKISKNPFWYFFWEMPCIMNLFYGTQKRNILKNVSICGFTFLNQCENHNEEVKTQYLRRYSDGIRGVSTTLNDYIFGESNSVTFIKNMQKYEKMIFSSLYGSMTYDKKLSYKFLNDFHEMALKINTGIKQSVYTFLQHMDNFWITQPERLRKIQDDLLPPLFTVRNMLSHCYKNWPDSGHPSDQLIEKINHIRQLIINEDYSAIMFEGLTYNKHFIMQNVHRDLHKAYRNEPIKRLDILSAYAN
jgi:hypothetical protein